MTRARSLSPRRSCLGRDDAFHHRIDGFQVTGVGRERDDDVAARGRAVNAGSAEVVLDVARALDAGGIDVAFKLGEDLGQRLAEHIGEHGDAAAVGHTHHQFVNVAVGGAVEQFAEDGHQGLSAFEREALVADEAGVQEMLERLGFEQPVHDAEARFGIERPAVAGGLHGILQPALLLRMLNVHVLHAHLAAIGVAQSGEDFAERGHRLVGTFAHGLAEVAGNEFAIEIPDGEAVLGGVELGVVAGLGAERVEIGDEVAADAISVDELEDGGFLDDLRAGGRAGAGEQGGALAIGLPAHGLVGELQVSEELFVELAVALEELLDLGQEHAGFGALDDAVIVSAGDAHHLADAQRGAGFGGDALVAGRVIDGAGGDDGSLAGHEAGHGGDGADGAGIGEGDGGRLEIGRGQLVRAGAGDEVVKGGEELLEVERAGVLDVGDEQGAVAVLYRARRWRCRGSPGCGPGGSSRRHSRDKRC